VLSLRCSNAPSESSVCKPLTIPSAKVLRDSPSLSLSLSLSVLGRPSSAAGWEASLSVQPGFFCHPDCPNAHFVGGLGGGCRLSPPETSRRWTPSRGSSVSARSGATVPSCLGTRVASFNPWTLQLRGTGDVSSPRPMEDEHNSSPKTQHLEIGITP